MLLEAKNPVCCYKVGWQHKKVVISGCLQIAKGQNVAVLGQSGAGKTTLAQMIAGLLKPYSGQILFEGQDVFSMHRSEKKRFFSRVQMVVQHPQSAFDPRWPMKRSLMEPYRVHRIGDSQKKMARLLTDVDLESGVLAKIPSQLSGGELQRLAVARALSLNPALLILDEPTSMLDMVTQARIFNLLSAMQQKSGFAMLLISHDEQIASRVCNRIYKLEGQSLIPV